VCLLAKLQTKQRTALLNEKMQSPVFHSRQVMQKQQLSEMEKLKHLLIADFLSNIATIFKNRLGYFEVIVS